MLYALETSPVFEYYLGLNNFYTVWQYNHSRMYVTAVRDIANAINNNGLVIRKPIFGVVFTFGALQNILSHQSDFHGVTFFAALKQTVRLVQGIKMHCLLRLALHKYIGRFDRSRGRTQADCGCRYPVSSRQMQRVHLDWRKQIRYGRYSRHRMVHR